MRRAVPAGRDRLDSDHSVMTQHDDLMGMEHIVNFVTQMASEENLPQDPVERAQYEAAEVQKWEDEKQPTVALTAIHSRPELNGQTAHICGYEQKEMRYCQCLLANQLRGDKFLLPSKVILSAGLEVTITGLKTEKWNGLAATVLLYDANSGRSTVLTDGGKQMNIKLENMLLSQFAHHGPFCYQGRPCHIG